jgi:DNA-3-methyladenine glycosylase II
LAARGRRTSVRSASCGRFHRAGDGRLIIRLDQAGLERAVADLVARDADLEAIVARYGSPPLWDRPPGFGTLVHLILEQQVSLASAKAAYDRLLAATDPLTPDAFLRLSDAELLAIGFSRQKARYGRALAAAILDGRLDLEALDRLDDGAVQAALEAVPGIGRWTSTIYLLMVLGRPDVWPTGDIALATAVGQAKRLPGRPDPATLMQIGEAWRPWRSVAARLFWHDYLARRRRVAGTAPGDSETSL